MSPARALPAVLIALISSVAALSTSLAPPVERAIEAIGAAELRTHVEALSSDEMAGRAVGHEGNRKAVEYVTQALRSAGVPSAAASYLQAVELYHASLGDDSRLTIGPPDGEPLADLQAGADFYPLPQSSALDVSAPLVFAGHGLTVPALRHDDYARRDVKGAIVLVEAGIPDWFHRRPMLTAAQVSDLSTVERKIADAQTRGAVGVIVVEMSAVGAQAVWGPAPESRDIRYRLYSELRARPVTAAVVSGHAAAPVRRALGDGTPLVATLQPGVTIHRLTVHNVLAAVEPAPAAPTRESVIVGAHLDHDGIGEDGRVFNGADDNASGTAAVLAIAGALARAADAGERPRRRVMFALWNAEEKGSLGADAFLAAAGTNERVIANLNLDMVGRAEHVPDPGDPRFRGLRRSGASDNANVVHLLGYSYSPDLSNLASHANERVGLTLRREYDVDAQDLIRRSDHWPFLKRGIPALFFTTGLHPDYHTPDDDAERIDYEKLERISELVGRLTWLVAQHQPPRFRGNAGRVRP